MPISKYLKTALVLFLAAILFNACKDEAPTVESPPEKEAFSIKPPIPDLDPKFYTFDFEAEKGGKFSLKNGSKITIPSNALVNTQGEAVTGKVTLRYREFHDAADIYLSGIPMEIQVEDKEEYLKTAGMFEIQAVQGEEALALAEGKSAVVRMASWDARKDYNFYNLDMESGNWDDLGQKDPIVNRKKVALKKEIAGMKPGQKFPLGSKYFTFSFMDFLDIYYNDKIKNADKGMITKLMNDYGLSFSNLYSWKIITYEGKKSPASFFVWKNLSGTPLPSYKDGHRTKLTPLAQKYQYQLEVLDKDKNATWTGEVEIYMSVKSLLAFPPEHWRNNYESAMAAIRKKQTSYKMMANVFREHEIMEFGIYNWDKIWKDRESVKLLAKFDLGEQKDKLLEKEVVFVSGDNKTVVRFPEKDWESLRLVKDKDARLFTLMPDQQIMLYSARKYNKINFKQLKEVESPSYSFDMKAEKHPIKSEKDLRKALGI